MSDTSASTANGGLNAVVADRLDRRSWPKAWPAFALLALAIGAFALGRESAQFLIEQFPKSAELLFYTAALFSLVLATVSKTPDDKAIRILSAGVGAVLALTALPTLLGYPVANTDFAGIAQRLFLIGPLVVTAFAIAAYWRPTTLIACGFFPLAERATIPWVSGMPIGSLDIYPVYEVALFVGTGSAILTGAKALFPKFCDDHRYFTLVWIFALGIHFGNYFYSGVAKLALDGPFFSWVFENQTNDTALLAAWYNGRWLLASNPELSVQIAQTLGALNTPSNLFVLVIQIAAPFAVLRMNWIKLQTILYDLMHLAIFFVVGILFWKWILLNLAFLASASRVARERFDTGAKAVGVLAVVLGFTVAQTAQLGWYNTLALSSRILYANTQDGESARVPTSFFLNQSYSVSHARFAVDDPDAFPTSPMGNTFRYAIHQAALRCDFSALPEAPRYRSSASRTEDAEATAQFIKAHHAFYLNLSDDGRFNYTLFPFHHFSNPAYYKAFFELDKRRVTSYTLVSRSHCIDAHEGRLRSRVQHESRYDIPVR
ncbi:MAG: hypothetical protein AAF692_01630 [Pseudomonadota bacterium]